MVKKRLPTIKKYKKIPCFAETFGSRLTKYHYDLCQVRLEFTLLRFFGNFSKVNIKYLNFQMQLLY